MPIAYKKGDLLKSNCDVIAHGCNCFCVMGAGIAKQIRYTFPKAHEADCKTSRGDINKLGNYSLAIENSKTSNKHIYVVNLYTQFSFGNSKCNISYEAIEKCFKSLYTITTKEQLVGIPMIGAGLGGGDWNQIESIINKIFHDRTIYVYQL